MVVQVSNEFTQFAWKWWVLWGKQNLLFNILIFSRQFKFTFKLVLVYDIMI